MEQNLQTAVLIFTINYIILNLDNADILLLLSLMLLLGNFYSIVAFVVAVLYSKLLCTQYLIA